MKPLKTVLFLILLGVAAAVCWKQYTAEMSLEAEDGHYTAEQAKIHLETRGITVDNFTAKQLEAAAAGDTELLALLIAAQPGSMVRDEHRNTPLHLSAGAGQLQACALLASSYQAVLSTNDLGQTPLHLAAANGHTACAELLLQREADINLSDVDGYTPLLYALEKGHTECAAMLIKAGATPYSRTGKGQTAFQLAEKHPEIRTLLEEAVQTQTAQKQQPTDKSTAVYLPTADLYSGEPVAHAILSGDAAAVEQLLREGQNPDHKYVDKLPLIILAVQQNNADILKMLLDAGADANARATTGETALHVAIAEEKQACLEILLAHHVDVNLSTNGITPLIKAITQGNTAIAEQLLKAGARVNEAIANGETALICAARLGNEEAIRLLQVAGADANYEGHGKTALIAAITNQHENCVKLLIEGGADVSYTPAHSRTALHHAAALGSAECTELLLQAKANADAVDTRRETPLHYAAKQGHSDIVKLLLQHGASADSKNTDEASALHLAAEAGTTTCIEALKAAGADIELKLPNGFTPLHHAAYHGKNSSIEALIAAGADMNACTGDGLTAVDIARQQAHQTCLRTLSTELLKDKGITIIDEQALITAIQAKQNDIQQLLMDAGCRYGDDAIYAAAACGNHEALSRMVQRKGRINATADCSPLHAAAGVGSTECVRLLINCNIPIDLRNSEGKTALKLATRNGHTACAHLLETAQNLSEKGYTPATYNKALLETAAKGDHLTLGRLIEVGANVHIKDAEGNTALHKAASHRVVTSVRLLLEAGANPNVLNADKISPLMIAVHHERSSTVRALIEKEARLDLMSDVDTATTLAVKENRVECLQILLAAGASVDSQDRQKKTLLQLAVSSNSPQIVQILLDKGANPNIGSTDDPLLFDVIRASAFDILRIMLESDKVDIKKVNRQGESAVHIAAQQGNATMLSLLLNSGLSAEVTDHEGLSLMHHAAKYGQTELLQQLIAANARVRVLDKKGRTPSYYAEHSGHTECAEMLKKVEEQENFDFTMPE
ncbi:MAG: ankyrin repeat domain-containing protein [Akkermansia sp.]|nr:ankyrin repeat domain-containing protein [Akkermansia sp.]